MKITDTQANALRLASEVPSCLSSDYYRPTVHVLLRRGLIESYGCMTVGDGASERFGITDAGREALMRR